MFSEAVGMKMASHSNYRKIYFKSASYTKNNISPKGLLDRLAVTYSIRSTLSETTVN